MAEGLVTEDSITYIVMLSAFQVVLNCQLELQDSVYCDAKATQKVREAVNILNLSNASRRNKMWKIDTEISTDIMGAIQIIGEQIAKNDAVALQFIKNLTKQGLDLSRCLIKELTDDELKDYKEQLAKKS